MDIDSLVAQGKYGEAAAEARRQGQLERAQKLYERIWDFRQAAEIARERGDRPELLRLLLDARDFVAAARVGESVQQAAPPEQERAAAVYERRRMWGEAAALRERLGQLERAHDLYKKAQQPLEVARLDETLGRTREAGILYEKLLSDEPGSPDAARAHLQLGRILAGFGRHDEAARHLQRAIAVGQVESSAGASATGNPGAGAGAAANAMSYAGAAAAGASSANTAASAFAATANAFAAAATRAAAEQAAGEIATSEPATSGAASSKTASDTASAKTTGAKTASAKDASAKDASAKTASAKTASAKTAGAKTASARTAGSSADETAANAAMESDGRRGSAPLDQAQLTRARRLLVVELAALGYREAARAALEPLRAADARLPPLDAFLVAERRAAGEDHAGATRLAGRYRVTRLLGSGGMGRVYLARDEFSGRDVAVKVVAPPVDERSADGYRRFMREAKIVSSLKHPHIVSLVESHEELGILALEFMAGGTLADRLSAPLPPSLVRTFAVEVLAGLEAAHAHGVIHRDLKPANIFFAASGEAKLGDFGVAHLSDLGATQTAGFIGTLAYMSPEQISGAPLTFAADVYALGITLYQALTGRLPFGGPDFVGQHLGERAPAPSSLKPELDGAWDLLVARALEKSPADRFGSLDELRRALAAIPVVKRAPGTPLAPDQPMETAAAAPVSDRYVVTSELDGNLLRATDTRLGREVVLELFAPGALDDEKGAQHLVWLRALARHGGPRLQRVLRIERLGDGATRVVFEALTGRTPRPPSLTPRERAVLLRALGPLHAAGVAHGSIAASLVLEDWGPALLTAGRRARDISVAEEQAELETLVSGK